jgi:methionyl-tRNA formyltransferase
MRIEFLTQDDPVYLFPFFDEFVRRYAGEVEIIHVGLCRTMGKRKRAKLAYELIMLYGILGFCKLAWRSVKSRVLSWRRKGPNAKTYHSIAQLCRAYRIPCSAVENPNSQEYVSDLKQRAPACLVSVACPYILRGEVFSIPPYGCINIHHAPLPRYKGMMPTFWQLYHGETSVGLTIHYVAARVDEGDALYQTRIDVRPGETLHELICRSKRHAARCLAEVLSKLETGQLEPLKMDQAKSTSFTFPTIEEISEFRLRGYRAI